MTAICKFILPFVFLSILLASCNLEQEVDIDLPPYQEQVMVECYLEPGKPYRLLLTRSNGYFEEIPLDPATFLKGLLEDSASVIIVRAADTIRLDNALQIDPANGKIYNYFSAETVPDDTLSEFKLFIRTRRQESMAASTRILPPVPIDSLMIEYQDSLARVLTFISDDPAEKNYYRRTLYFQNQDSIEQDFTTDDRILNSSLVVFGTFFKYKKGEKVISIICHIDKAYYDFLESVQGALQSNGNPFGQPTPIRSNVSGSANPTGIFTGLRISRKEVVIP